MTTPAEILHSGLRALLAGGAYRLEDSPYAVQSDPLKPKFGLLPPSVGMCILTMASYIGPDANTVIHAAQTSSLANDDRQLIVFVDASAVGPQMRICSICGRRTLSPDSLSEAAHRTTFLRKRLLDDKIIYPEDPGTNKQYLGAWWDYLTSSIPHVFSETAPPELFSIISEFYPDERLLVIAKIDNTFGAISSVEPFSLSAKL